MFSMISILSLKSHIPFIAVGLGYTSIVETFQVYSSKTQNKTLLKYATDLISYLLPLT